MTDVTTCGYEPFQKAWLQAIEKKPAPADEFAPAREKNWLSLAYDGKAFIYDASLDRGESHAGYPARWRVV